MGREEQRPDYVGQVAGGRAVEIVTSVITNVTARVDVLDEGGAGCGAVALPQLVAVHAVIGREEQYAVYVREFGGVRADPVRVDVLKEGGTGSGAVAPPQFGAVQDIVRR